MKMIKIAINELILDGFDYHDHIRISNAIEQELSRLMKYRGLPEGFTKNSDFIKIDAGSFSVEVYNPRSIGIEVARSIYRSWSSNSNNLKIANK